MSVEKFDKPKAVKVTAEDVTIKPLQISTLDSAPEPLQASPVKPVSLKGEFARVVAPGAPPPNPYAKLILPEGDPRTVVFPADPAIDPAVIKLARQDADNGIDPILRLAENMPPGTRVIRTDRDATWISNETAEMDEIAEALIKKSRQGGQMSPEENAQFERNIQIVSTDTTMGEPLMRELIASKEIELTRYELLTTHAFSSISGSKNLDPEAEAGIADLLKQKVRGTITEDQSRDLDSRMQVYAHNHDISSADMQMMSENYMKAIQSFDKERDSEKFYLTEEINSLGHTVGTQKNTDIYIAKDPKQIDDALPNLAMSPEAKAFMVALHESAHLEKGAMPSHFNNNFQRTIARETHADRFAIGHAPDLGPAYIASRNLSAFSRGDIMHDTAPYLRQPQLDIAIAQPERSILLRTINNQMGVEPGPLRKPGDVAGALQDILKQDSESPSSSKKLSEAQKAWAEEYIQDARAMGHEPNPAYIKAEAVDPQAFKQAQENIVNTVQNAFRPT